MASTLCSHVVAERLCCCLYRQALKPRLLVPVGLAAGMAAYNQMSQQPLQGMEQASLLAGFLSYKVHDHLLANMQLQYMMLMPWVLASLRANFCQLHM